MPHPTLFQLPTRCLTPTLFQLPARCLTPALFQLPARCLTTLSSFPHVTEFFFLTAFHFASEFCVRPPSCLAVLRNSPFGLQLQNMLRPHVLSARVCLVFRLVHCFRQTVQILLARSQFCEKLPLVSPYLPVCLSVGLSAWNSSASTGRIFKLNLIFEYFSKIC